MNKTAVSAMPCLGKCGVDVVPPKFACPTCWGRLPEELQRAITWTFGRGRVALHLQAIGRGRAWYFRNPAPARALASSRG